MRPGWVLPLRTSLQQHADGAWVISQRGVVKRCAATEAGPAAEPAAEFILSGHEDCRERQKTRKITIAKYFYLQNRRWLTEKLNKKLGLCFFCS